MADPLEWIDEALADLDRRGLRRTLAERAGPQRGDRIEIGGLESQQPALVNFGSNDYLGLASDERVVAAARAAMDEYGWGSGASPLVTGRSALHAELERKLAEFEGTEAALLFPTGYAANVGTITALVGKGDAIYSDELNHASIIDGCRLSGAAIEIYPHRNLGRLQEMLCGGRGYRRRLIVTDSLFSMHGDLAPLDGLHTLAERFHCMFLVDEAHATGVFGARGRGLCEAQGIEEHVHVRVGTLSKALGSVGGFVAGQKRLIDWLANRARPYVFSTATPPAAAAAALAALEIVHSEPARRTRLLKLSQYCRQVFLRHGLDYGHSFSQIVPVILGDERRVMAGAQSLRRQGFFVPAIRPPSVPEGDSLLRVSLTHLHAERQIEDLAVAVRQATR